MRGTTYSSPDYAMGADERQPRPRGLPKQAQVPEHAANAPVTRAEKVKAEAEIRRMRRALKGWLKYRGINNAVAAGKHKAKISAKRARLQIAHNRDWRLEQKLADELHVLLSEVFDAGQLPDPDLRRDPDAAVKLAKIAISGRLPGEAPAPEGQGLIWMWPAVIVVGLVLFTIVFKIRSDAQTAQEKERIECIKMGACTDYGFWLKMGGVLVGAWIVWEKFGLKELAARSRKKASG